jgi:putative ABC transport system ATP-binding protein
MSARPSGASPANLPHLADPGPVVLEARGVCKYFQEKTAAPVRALDDVSLVIARGEFCALTGPSGSGKTTLLALLGALDRASRGQVLFHGRDLGSCSDAELARLRRRTGFIFQDLALIPTLPAWENITYPLIPRGLATAERYERARALLGRFGLADKAAARPAELSGGERQRVAIARALAGDPEVLLADEPTSSLDPAAAEAIKDLLAGVHAEGRTVIVATHDARLLALAGSIYKLEAGRLRARGPETKGPAQTD